MAARSFLTWLTLFVLVTDVPAGATDKAVGFRDDFATDSLTAYQLRGEVAWQPGAVLLGGGARLRRTVPAGDTLDLRAVVRWKGDQNAELRLRVLDPASAGLGALLTGPGPQPLAALRRTGGQVRLSQRTSEPAQEAALGPTRADAWAVRLLVSHGLVHVKAWRHGAAEPAAWSSLRGLERPAWRPGLLEVESAGPGGVALELLAVTGRAPLVPSAEKQKQLQQVKTLHDEMIRQMNRGQFGDALAGAREALDLHRRALPPDHPDLARSLNYLGRTLHMAGQVRAAQAPLEEALALRRRALPPGHPEVGRSLNNLGGLLLDLGQFDRARSLLEEALAVARRTLPPLHHDVAACLHNLGNVSWRQGRLDEARTHIEEALAVQKKRLPPRSPLLAPTLNNLGLLLYDLGRPAEARAHLEEVLSSMETMLPADHPDLARCHNNLGGVLWGMGLRAQGRPHLERAVALLRKAVPARSQELAQSLNNLGKLLHDDRRLPEARPLLEESVALRRQHLPPGHPDLAQSLSNLGLLLQDLGKFDEAQEHLEEALTLFRKALPPRHPQLAKSLGNLGNLWAHRGRYDQARTFMEQALALWREALPPLHPDLVTGEMNLGCVLVLAEGPEAAWPHLAAGVAVQGTLRRRASLGTAQREHGPLRSANRPYLSFLLNVAERLPNLTADQGQALLLAVLDSKAVSAWAVCLRREALRAAGDGASRLRARELAQVSQELANLLLQGAGRLPPATYRQRCLALQRRQDELENDLARRVQNYAQQRLAEQAGLDDLARALPADAVLVELVRYHHFDFKAWRWGADRYAALLLGRGSADDATPAVRFLALGAARPLDEAVAAWRKPVQAGTTSPDAERELRRLLWGPLAGALPAGTRELVIAPEGALALLPFEALRLADGKYLVETVHVRYVGGGRDLVPPPRPRVRSAAALVLADPAYDSAGEPGANVPGGVPPVANAPGAPGLRFTSLPGFAREADAVAKLLQGRPGWQVQQLRQGQATEEGLAAAPRPRLLYCVTHGFFLPDREAPAPAVGLGRSIVVQSSKKVAGLAPPASADPRLRSGLALAGANKWQERSAKGLSDGLLTALEVENLELWGTELVVLSACETGRGAVQVGEGVLGLRRAFQLAGAQAVLASLWMVPDTETERLMTDCLRRWLDGAPPAAALRQAQLQLIRQLRQSANPWLRAAPPLYWAGFICHGQAGPPSPKE
jgi:CHAT domain-containing protein/Tfp pilus assembly protein PilF